MVDSFVDHILHCTSSLTQSFPHPHPHPHPHASPIPSNHHHPQPYLNLTLTLILTGLRSLLASHSRKPLGQLRSSDLVSSELRKALCRSTARVSDLLREWDVGGDGEVDRKELSAGLRACGLDASDSEISILFDQWDQHKNGAPAFAHRSLPPPQTTLLLLRLFSAHSLLPPPPLALTPPLLRSQPPFS